MVNNNNLLKLAAVLLISGILLISVHAVMWNEAFNSVWSQVSLNLGMILNVVGIVLLMRYYVIH